MFRSEKDFFIRKNVLLLTSKRRERVRDLRITGKKIPDFFDLEQTPFQIWANFNNFYEKSKDLKAEKLYLEKVESKLRKFVNEKTNMNFEGYSSDYSNVFDNKVFGGVPDGEFWGEKEKVISTLEIKTPHWNKARYLKEKEFVSYLLQLGLYLYLRDIDIGYLCIADLGQTGKWQYKEERLITFLKNPKEEETIPRFKFGKNLTLLSKFSELNNLSFGFEILESKRYVNNEHEIYLMKVKIDKEQYSKIIKGCEKWLEKYRYESPEIIPHRDCLNDAWRKIY